MKMLYEKGVAKSLWLKRANEKQGRMTGGKQVEWEVERGKL